MIEFIKKYSKVFEVLVILFMSLTPLLWLKDGQIILGHDSGFRLDPIAHLRNLFYSWDSSANFGTDWSWFKGFLITQAPETFFIALTKSFTVGQQLTFIFWFFSIGISMYIFINAFFKEKDYWFFRVFASIFYIYNFFLLQAWFITERAKFSLFSLLPLGTLLIYKTLTREYSILKGFILFSLVSVVLNAGGNLTFYGVLLLAYGITFIYVTVVNILRGGKKELIYSLKALLLFLVGFLAVNAYWAFPQLYLFFSGYSNLGSVGGIDGIIRWESVIAQNASFINLLRLQGMPDWYDNSLHTYGYIFTNNPALIAFSFIFPFILLSGLLYHRKLSVDKNKNQVIILVLLFLFFGFLFTAGSHPPSGFIYVFLIKFIPGFAIFRSAFYKFGGILWLSYIFLFSFYLNLFLLRLIKGKKRYALVGIFSFGLLLAYHFPFFQGNFFTWNKPFTTKVELPRYVNEMAEYINKLPSDTRILLLPKFGDQADSYQWGFWGVDSLPRLFTNKSIVANSSSHAEIINSIYYSVEKNDENTFLRLAGISGITKVLWREDMLYSDKTKTSKNFISVKQNLESFKGIKLEKKIGAWSLYKIELTYYVPTFSNIDSIIYAQSETSILRNIFNEEKDVKNLAILFEESMEDKDKNILLSSGKKVIGAECIACSSEVFNSTGGKLLEMPKIKILPNSPFYHLLSLREQQVQRLHANSPSRRIDADLGYANKRIVEMKEIATAKVKETNPKLFVRQGIKKYKTLITDSIEQAGMLSEDSKNEAYIKILTYLNSQLFYLRVQKGLYDYALEDFEELSIFMQDQIGYLKGKIWVTNLSENKIRYFLSIDSPGMYDFHITSAEIQTRTITVDGKKITDYKNIYLTKGIHKLEISYYGIENLTEVQQATESGELNLAFGQRKKFPFKEFDSEKTYFVSFDYKITGGRPNASIVEKEKNTQYIWNLFLNQNTVWNSFSSIFTTIHNSRSVTLEFFPTGFEKTGAEIQVKNLRIFRVDIPEVFVSRNVISQTNLAYPRISFYRVSPTLYKVDIKNATSPYLLVFGESYTKGWRAYIADDFFQTFSMQPIPEEKHYILNDYSNGWLVDKNGNYSIIVEYFPQKIFYSGLFVSGVSLFILSLILLRRRKKL